MLSAGLKSYKKDCRELIMMKSHKCSDRESSGCHVNIKQGTQHGLVFRQTFQFQSLCGPIISHFLSFNICKIPFLSLQEWAPFSVESAYWRSDTFCLPSMCLGAVVLGTVPSLPGGAIDHKVPPLLPLSLTNQNIPCSPYSDGLRCLETTYCEWHLDSGLLFWGLRGNGGNCLCSSRISSTKLLIRSESLGPFLPLREEGLPGLENTTEDSRAKRCCKLEKFLTTAF